MESFDLRKYLAENKLLKEDVDVNKILSDGGYDIIDDEELLMTVKSRLKGKSNIDAEKLNLLVMKIEDEEGGNIDFTENKLLKESEYTEYVPYHFDDEYGKTLWYKFADVYDNGSIFKPGDAEYSRVANISDVLQTTGMTMDELEDFSQYGDESWSVNIDKDMNLITVYTD